MKNILLIGVGGAGSKTVDIFYKKIKEFGMQTDNHISAIVFDTDKGDIDQIKDATPIPMADPASVGTICDRLGKRYLREWFPCDDPAVRSQEMIRGASQWRKKSYLAFLNLMNKPELRSRFTAALEGMSVDPNASCEVYVISSVAGGTGSGSFIPIALYAKRFLRKSMGKDPIVNAMIQLPDIFAESQTEDNKTKVFANAYAILRELNAINLVARNYNEGRTERKKSQIKLRIGSPEDQNVGVLFDSTDPAFWTPSAAPFSQIFMLDRIPGVSPFGHNIVLANSLYTIICTQTGSEFDSEASNHEVVRSQNNGSNAIFAGVSTAQIRFPEESVLEYLAYERTLASCNSDWMALHNAAENKIREREQQAKEMGNRYTMKDGEYAEIMLEAFENLKDNENRSLVELVELDTTVFDEEGNRREDTNTAEEYYNECVAKYLEGLIPRETLITSPEAKNKNANKTAKEVNKDYVVKYAKTLRDGLETYFGDCVGAIRRSTSSTVDAVLCFDPHKAAYAGKKIALEENLLKKNGKYLHPVAAVIQLSRLKQKLVDELKNINDKPWEALKMRGNVAELPKELCLKLSSQSQPGSAYSQLSDADGRFYKMVYKNQKWYHDSKTKTRPLNDFKLLSEDAEEVVRNISKKAQIQLKLAVLTRVSENVQLLLDKYREFFKRFEQEKENLKESVKVALRKDCGLVNSVENVFSSEAAKKRIHATVSSDAGSETENDLREAYDIAGRGVFQTVYGNAVAAKKVDESETGAAKFNDKDAAAYRNLFSDMVKSYEKFIKKGDTFKGISEYNVIQAIEKECGENPSLDEVSKALYDHFNRIGTLAEPSLKVNMGGDMPELIMPSKVMVYMMSRNTGYYIKKRADFYDISVPVDQASEDAAIKACAEAFVKKYSGIESARTVIVKSMPDQILYCTGEIMDITPLRIAKLDEFCTDKGAYFHYYQTAIENSKKYDTDMWNPHLGYGFEKRGYLPYMNEKMEELCDIKMAKALLYALASGEVFLGEMEIVKGEGIPAFYRLGEGTAIKSEDNTIIGMQNVAQLVNWARNQDEFAEEYSTKYDEAINVIKASLPNIASDQEVATLKSQITVCDFIGQLCCGLFEIPESSRIKEFSGDAVIKGANFGVYKKNDKDDKKVKDDKVGKKIGPSILEFAYKIKISEEASRDNDDAERIISVAHDTFREICACRANPETNMERFIEIYKHELNNVFLSIARSKLVQDAKENAVEYFKQIVSWLNGAGLFLDIPEDDPFEGSSIKYRRFKITDASDEVAKALSEAKKVPEKPAKVEEAPAAEEAPADEEN